MDIKALEQIENTIAGAMQGTSTPGLCIAIVQDGKIIYEKGFGARNFEKNLPMTPDTLYGIGSTSKSFTTLAIMQLVEAGKINLKAPVSEYIDFRLGSSENPITIHHIMSHSSGIPELEGATYSIGKVMIQDLPILPLSSEQDFLRHINGADSEIIVSPGEHFYYCNDMFAILGLIIEKVSGMNFVNYIRKNIFAPLGMDRSTYLEHEFEADPLDDKMQGYIPGPEGKGIKPSPFPYDKFTYAAGGIISSVREMAKYMAFMMGDGTAGETRVISSESIQQLWGTHTKTTYAGDSGYYGYGWMSEPNFFGKRIVHHGGNIVVSSGWLGMVPELNIGVVVGQNDGKPLSGMVGQGILGVLIGGSLEEAVPEYAAQQYVKQICGKYAIYKNLFTIEVVNQGNILMISGNPALGFDRLPLAPKDFKNFTFELPSLTPARWGEIQFVRDEKTGKYALQIDRYVFHQL